MGVKIMDNLLEFIGMIVGIIIATIIALAFGLVIALPFSYMEWKSYRNVTGSQIEFSDYFWTSPQINDVRIRGDERNK
jgi:uncharacterized membrane protein